jgi:ABC-type glycerol-3-phosphate transport system substrate-binding protein
MYAFTKNAQRKDNHENRALCDYYFFGGLAMKKMILVLMILVLAISIVWARGAGEAQRAERAAGTAEFWHYWASGAEKDAFEAFMEVVVRQNRGFTFTERTLPSSGEMWTQVGNSLLAGDPPSLFQSNVGVFLRRWVDANHLHRLDDIWAEIDGENIFSEGVKSTVKIDGHVYAIPVNTHVISHIFYNREIFNRFGLTPPRTVAEFLHICEVLRRNNIEPVAMNGRTASFATYHIFPFLVNSLGPEGYMDLSSGRIAFTDPRVRRGFEDFGNILVPNMMFGWAGYTWVEAANEVVNGNAAMLLNGDWAIAFFEDRGWRHGIEYDFFHFPGNENSAIVQIDGLVATVRGGDPAAQRAFLLSGAGAEAQAAFNRHKGSVAANLNVRRETYGSALQKTYDRLQELSRTGYVLPNLLITLPAGVWEEMLRQTVAYALSPTPATLNTALTALESARQTSLNRNEFANFSRF